MGGFAIRAPRVSRNRRDGGSAWESNPPIPAEPRFKTDLKSAEATRLLALPKREESIARLRCRTSVNNFLFAPDEFSVNRFAHRVLPSVQASGNERRCDDLRREDLAGRF